MTTQRRQTIAHHAHGGLRLSGLNETLSFIPSPYTKEMNGIGLGRDTNISTTMIEVYVNNFQYGNSSDDNNAIIQYDLLSVTQGSAPSQTVTIALPASQAEVYDAIVTAIIAQAYSNWTKTITENQIVMVGGPGLVGTKSFANPSRSLNSAFQISTTRDAQVSYTGNTTNTLSLSGGTQGTDYLEYADDSGFTTNVVEVGHAVSSNTGTLTLGLNTSQISAWTLSGVIPAGKYVRVRTQNNTGSPTHTLVKSQEVLV